MEGQKGLARAAEQPEAREVADLVAGAQARCSGACRRAMALATIGAGKADRARGIDRSPNRLIAAGIDRRFLDEQKRARKHGPGWILTQKPRQGRAYASPENSRGVGGRRPSR